MAADTDHFDALDSLADTHQKKLAESLVTLENRIADLVATAPLQDGKLFDLEWAVNARNELRQAIDEDYLTEVDSIIRDYDQVAVDAATMLGEYGDIVQLDQDVVGQLQQMTFQGFEDLGAEHLDIISKQVYESTLTGATFANSVNAVREVVGKDMARHASQQVHDSLMQFDRAVNTKIALDSGAEKFKYRGSDDSKTRTFCRKHVDKVYTIDEINEIWQGEWAGKSSSNAFATAGGYNCRHRFRPVFDEVAEEVVEEVAPPPEPEPVTDLQTKPIKKLSKAAAVKSAEKKLKYKPEQWKTVSEGSRDFYSYPVDSDGTPMLRFRGKGISQYSNYTTRVNSFNLQTGKVTGTTFSAETLTLVDNALDITADLSKQYKIPQIRAITPTGDKSAAMSMGDMNLSINASYWKPRAATAFVDESEIRKSIAKETAKLRALDDDMQLLADKYAETKAKYFETRDYALLEEYNGYADDYNKKRSAKMRVNRSISRMEQSIRPQTASTWRVGDDLKDRPELASRYFDDPVDKFNNTVVHEYGHTLHQEYNRIGTERGKGLMSEPPVEKYLAHLFYDKKNKKKLNPNNVYPTGYSEYNHHEWFAESFSLYNMGRKDLVDPKLVNLLDEMKKNKGHLDVFDGFDFKLGEVIDE